MMGASGSGKSTFAAKHFLATEIVSSDRCRGYVADDEADQSAMADAFDVLCFITAKRLAARRLTVIDATNLRAGDRKHAIELARKFHALPVVFAFDIAEAVCAERNRGRADRQFGNHVVRNHVQLLRRSLRGLQREAFRIVHTLASPEARRTARGDGHGRGMNRTVHARQPRQQAAAKAERPRQQITHGLPETWRN